MRYRTFGRTGWSVSEVGYGMWGMAGWSGSADDESLASLDLAIEMGCTFFDTAWAYGDGYSERLLGQTLRRHPGRRLYAATKIPPKNRLWPAGAAEALRDVFPPDYIREYAERSLANIGVQTIDLLQFHVWNDAWADDPSWQRACSRYGRKGSCGPSGSASTAGSRPTCCAPSTPG
jgi:aryl-alcohol dehydrogenase-like predicted oxidoreductase